LLLESGTIPARRKLLAALRALEIFNVSLKRLLFGYSCPPTPGVEEQWWRGYQIEERGGYYAQV